MVQAVCRLILNAEAMIGSKDIPSSICGEQNVAL
jgi:hypothetical protein